VEDDMMHRVATSSLSALALLAGMIAAPAARGLDDMAARSVSATYLATAEVARIDPRTGQLTLRSQGRSVTVERDAESPAIQGLRPGTPVLVGYRVERDARGHERRFLVALHNNSPSPATRTTTVITSQQPPSVRVVDGVSAAPGRVAAVDWSISEPSRTQPWTTTVAPPAGGGIPLRYVTDSIPSVPVPTRAPVLALPPASVTAVPNGDMDARALQAARDFQLAAAQLAQSADIIDRAWAAHRDLCINGALTPTSRDREWFRLLDGDLAAPDRDNCRVQRDELTRTTQRFRDQLQAAAASAEAAGLLPGQIREVLVRNRINL
jgi:hypothetical protein